MRKLLNIVAELTICSKAGYIILRRFFQRLFKARIDVKKKWQLCRYPALSRVTIKYCDYLRGDTWGFWIVDKISILCE